MNLDLTINIKESKDCKNFYFFDSTPLWNALSAPNGYDPTSGSGFNPASIDLPNSKLNITLPSGIIKTITFVSGDKSVSRLTTTGINLIQKTITYTDLGFTSNLDDGVYKFDYRIQDAGGIVYIASCYIVNDCQACCCLDAKLAALKFCSTCTDQYSRDVRALYDLYLKRDSAKMLAACGDYTSATEALNFLLSECGISNCDSCNN